jgi:hypothetical protein
MPTQLLVSEQINAPIEVVWPWVAQLEKHGEWSPKPFNIELVFGQLNQVGSKYRSLGFIPPAEKNHENQVEIVESIPNSRFAFKAHDANGYFENVFTLKSVAGGTEVTFHHVFPKMVGMARILLPLLLPIVGKRDAMTRLGMLKSKAEASK